ncbi:MAG: hypothetical protein OCD76_23420 [Reichenbachiella sp.]
MAITKILLANTEMVMADTQLLMASAESGKLNQDRGNIWDGQGAARYTSIDYMIA